MHSLGLFPIQCIRKTDFGKQEEQVKTSGQTDRQTDSFDHHWQALVRPLNDNIVPKIKEEHCLDCKTLAFLPGLTLPRKTLRLQ